MKIKKASGEMAFFSAEKLESSLMRAGASEQQAEEILQEINGRLYEGISTKQIYKLAFKLLKESSRHLAAKYHLKRAIMELGPSGFPFEKFIAEIFRYQRHTVVTGKIVAGKCVNHEIDVIATNHEKQLYIECKYHSQQGIFCDVKVPLYIRSRFTDVMEQRNTRDLPFEGWVITNTRFSADAVKYGTCAGLRLMGWDYPSKKSLKEQIDQLKLYPITCLTSLTRAEKQQLLEKNKVLCHDIRQNPELLSAIGLKPGRMETALQEVHLLCRNTVVTNLAGTYAESKNS